MEVTHLDAGLPQIVGKVLGHALGQGGDQHPFSNLHPLADFLHKVVYLTGYRFDNYLGVHQAGGTYDLLCHPSAVLLFIGTGGGADIYGLGHQAFKFRKDQGPVVQGRGQAEAVLHQHRLAGTVAIIHSPDLGQSDMGFIHHQEKVFRKVVNEGGGPAAGRAAGQVAGIVFNALAEAHFLHHFQIIAGPLLQALSLQEFVLPLKPGQLFLQFGLNALDSFLHQFFGSDKVRSGKNRRMTAVSQDLAGEAIDFGNPLHLIPEELHPDGPVAGAGRKHLQHISTHPKGAAVKVHIVAGILHLYQAAQHLVPGMLAAHPQGKHMLAVLFRRAQAVDTGDAGHNDDIPALKESTGG